VKSPPPFSAPVLALAWALGFSLANAPAPAWAQPETSPPQNARRTIDPGAPPRPLSGVSGPWGQIVLRERIIEPPGSYYVDYLRERRWSGGTVWRLPGTVEEARDTLRRAGLPVRTIDMLTSFPQMSETEGACHIVPPSETLLTLQPRQRLLLYPHVGESHANDPFLNPYVLLAGGIPRMTRRPHGIAPARLALIEQLSYGAPGAARLFSDLRFVLERAQDDGERMAILKFLCREIALEAFLELPEDREDPEARQSLLDYWNPGGRNASGAALLAAAWDNPRIRRLDLVHLLPPEPRKRLNSYATIEASLAHAAPDCFSTAFSFFSDHSPTRFLETITPALNERYERAEAPWQFGDLVVLVSREGRWLHACNHVAGELVFTKNGHSLGRPWVLQSLDEVLSAYLGDESLSVYFYRLKPAYRE